MAKKSKKSIETNISGSVKQSPGVTTGRQEREQRIASGNTRGPSAAAAERALAARRTGNRGK